MPRGVYVHHRRSLNERFCEKVNRSGGCWTWTGATVQGYGSLTVDTGKTDLAHRVAWTLASGLLIPKTMYVLHTCDDHACVRNDEPGIYVIRGLARPRFGHLWLGTQLDNMADMVEKGRASRGEARGQILKAAMAALPSWSRHPRR